MWIFGRKGASGFSARSTAEEVARGIDGSALTAIVTGASSGIGAETTRVLASCDVHVIMAVRNVDKGKRVKETIIELIPDARIDVMELDLSSFASVRKFACEYKSLGLPLNLLMGYAYGFFFQAFKDNIELHFATNHLGHFLLTNLLLDNMRKSARDSGREGRIVNVSSMGHKYVTREGICFDKINDSSSYSGMSAYGRSKLANILHANELSRRLLEEGVEISANSLHPGAIPLTNIAAGYGVVGDAAAWICGLFLKNVPQGAATTCYVALHPQVKGVTDVVKWICRPFLKTIPQGAATTCYVALHPQVTGLSGKYFSDCNISTPSSLASDAQLANKLWDFSLDLTQES